MTTKILVPEMGESVVDATVGRWLKKPGDHVGAGETVVELDTDKVNMQVGAEHEGTLTQIEKREGEDVKIGDVLGIIAEGAGAKEETKQEPALPPIPQPVQATPKDGERATPVAKRYAEERGVDLADVSSMVPNERVTREDIDKFLATQKAKKVASPQPEAKPSAPQEMTPRSQPPAPSRERDLAGPVSTGATPSHDREERVHMSRRRRTIAERLVQAHQTAAILTTFNEIDMQAVIEIRRRRREPFKQMHDVDLGFMSFFVRSTIGALKAFPRLNAELDGDDIVLKHYFDIGVAVGAEEGLVVPVLRDADRMTFAEIERTIAGFVDKSKSGTLSVQDLRGGTFTISNGGVFGSLLSTPILNTPQVGILGLHKIEDRPIAKNGEIVIRPMMYIALSYDHRLVDGREAVQFLVMIKRLVEDPESLLLEG